MRRVFTAIIKVLFGWSAWIFFRTKYVYEDKLKQGRKIRKSTILVSNHLSGLDFVLMMLAFPLNDLRCLVGESLYDCNQILKCLFKLLGCIKVDRFKGNVSFLTKTSEVLSKGGVIEMYPEARFPKKGEPTPLPFYPTVIHIARATGAKILPVYHTLGKPFSRASMVIGKPMDVSELLGEDELSTENVQVATDALRSKIIALGEKLR